LQILELDVFGSVIGPLARDVFALKAVDHVAAVVDDEDVLDAHVFTGEQGIFDAAEYFIEVLVALQAVEAETDTGHDRLFLLDDHPGVVLHRAEVEVVLNAEGKSKH
jgi:hypothetical protein